MSEWLLIILLLFSGLLLIIIELIFIPGTTIIGIFGILSILVGVYYGFEYYGRTVGIYILMATTVISGISLYFSFKSEIWMRFALKGTIKSKVNEGLFLGLEEGQEGISMSVLKPVGRVAFGEKIYEVSSLGMYIKEKIAVRIVKIQGHKVFVEPLKS